MIPIKPAKSISSIGIYAHLIEHIGADLHFPGLSTQQADALVKIHLHIVILGPVFYGTFHADTIGDITERAIEFILLLRCENITVDLDVHFAFSLVVLEKRDVIHKLFVVHFVAGKVPVLLAVHTLYGDVDPIKARIDDLQTPLRCQ